LAHVNNAPAKTQALSYSGKVAFADAKRKFSIS